MRCLGCAGMCLRGGPPRATVLGTFAIYSREPRSPTSQERKLIEQFAHVASVAIEHTRAQESLRRSEAKYRDPRSRRLRQLRR